MQVRKSMIFTEILFFYRVETIFNKLAILVLVGIWLKYINRVIIVSFIDLSYFWHFDVLFGPKWPHFRNSQVKFLQHPCPDSWPLDLRISSISTTYESLIFWLNFLILEIWMHYFEGLRTIFYISLWLYIWWPCLTLFGNIWPQMTLTMF